MQEMLLPRVILTHRLTNLINGAPGTLDTLKEIADEIQAGGTFYDAVVLSQAPQ